MEVSVAEGDQVEVASDLMTIATIKPEPAASLIPFLFLDTSISSVSFDEPLFDPIHIVNF